MPVAKELKFEQRTEEWFEARQGKATASRFKDVLATTKNGSEAAARRNYRAELSVERLTGISPERYLFRSMQWGDETEELARVEYILKSGNQVEETGLFIHKEIAAGASPDGVVGKDGTIEIKCREIALHIQMLKFDRVTPEYIAQVQGQLWLTGRKWCDFVSFVPELPDNAQLFIKRVERDDAYIATLEEAVRQFLQEVDQEVEFIKNYRRTK
jgi:predicted phage-related endonuclease